MVFPDKLNLKIIREVRIKGDTYINEYSCLDRNGVPVYCSRECWAKHICIHAEMIGQQELIKLIIKSPMSEYQDVRHVDTRNLYKTVVLPLIGSTLVKVSIRYERLHVRERGFVKTAYATNRVKAGEVWLWGHKFTK